MKNLKNLMIDMGDSREDPDWDARVIVTNIDEVLVWAQTIWSCLPSFVESATIRMATCPGSVQVMNGDFWADEAELERWEWRRTDETLEPADDSVPVASVASVTLCASGIYFLVSDPLELSDDPRLEETPIIPWSTQDI